MIWIIILEIVFWVLHYVSIQNVKSDVELWGKEL